MYSYMRYLNHMTSSAGHKALTILGKKIFVATASFSLLLVGKEQYSRSPTTAVKSSLSKGYHATPYHFRGGFANHVFVTREYK